MRDTEASYRDRFCTRFVRDMVLATITQEMHIAKEASSLRACALIDVTRRSS